MNLLESEMDQPQAELNCANALNLIGKNCVYLISNVLFQLFVKLHMICISKLNCEFILVYMLKIAIKFRNNFQNCS